MNLEKLNLVELDARETETIDGGWWGALVRAAGYILTATGAYDAIKDFSAGAAEGAASSQQNCGCNN